MEAHYRSRSVVSAVYRILFNRSSLSITLFLLLFIADAGQQGCLTPSPPRFRFAVTGLPVRTSTFVPTFAVAPPPAYLPACLLPYKKPPYRYAGNHAPR